MRPSSRCGRVSAVGPDSPSRPRSCSTRRRQNSTLRGKVARQQQELEHVGRVERRPVRLAVGLRRRRRLQRPEPVVERRQCTGGDAAVADVEQPAGHLGPLEHPADLQEPPAVVARHRLGGDAGQGLAAALDHAVEHVRAARGRRAGRATRRSRWKPLIASQSSVEHLLAQRPDVLAGAGDRRRGSTPGSPRRRRGTPTRRRRQVAADGRRTRTRAARTVSRSRQARSGLERRRLEQAVVGHVEHPGGVLGPLDVPPVQNSDSA